MAIAAIGFTAFAVTGHEADLWTRPFFIMAVFLIACLVWTFGTPGLLRWSKHERSLLNDELVRLNQHRAAQVGFGIALAGLAATAFQPSAIGMAAQIVAVISLAAAIIGAALTFAWFEHVGK
ncbi:hypothetical protein [Sphingomonas sp.]|uniref:hypothetical protein n=1 Tax=Sphingomonas sp. TaxID=28214 RepID=UPI0035BC7FBE